MILLANLLNATAKILHYILMLYVWILLFRVILSWVSIPALYQVRVILFRLTEPLLRKVRRFVPPYKYGGLDLSPIIIFILILFIDTFLVKSLALYAQQILVRHTYSF